MASLAGVRTLEVILTASCNLRCGYCYQNAKQARHMEWATLREALDLLLHSDQRDCAVLFIGGEPLLQLPLIERAVAHVGAHRPPWKSVRFVTSTNGTLLDEASLAFLARHDFDTQISFDGVPAAQEFRGPGTHRKIDRALDTMRRQHPAFFRRRLNVAMTLHSGNLPYLADSVDYLIDKQVPTIGIAPLTTPDPGWTLASMDTLRRQLARVFERSLAHYRATGQVPLELFRKRDGAPTRRPAGRSMCGVARGEAIAVDVDGQVTGCVTFAESYQRPDNDFLRRSLTSMRMGNIAEPGLAERMARYPEATAATGIFDRKQDKYSSLARCGECRFLAECAICPTGIGHIPGNADPRRVPDAACAFNLVSLELRERFPAQPSLADLLIGRAPVPTLLRELLERAGGGAGEARA